MAAVRATSKPSRLRAGCGGVCCCSADPRPRHRCTPGRDSHVGWADSSPCRIAGTYRGTPRRRGKRPRCGERVVEKLWRSTWVSKKGFTPVRRKPFRCKCRRQDLNLHCQLRQPGPQPGASANSATPAWSNYIMQDRGGIQVFLLSQMAKLSNHFNRTPVFVANLCRIPCI